MRTALRLPVTLLGVCVLCAGVRAVQGSATGREETGPAVRMIWDVKPPFTFAIATTTPDGKPQPGVRVHCVHPRPERGPALVDTTAVTDDNGTVRITVPDVNLVTDRYIWFSVADDQFASNGGVGISPIDREFTWTFKTLPLQKRTAQVVDPQGKGIPGAKVWLGCSHVFLDPPDSCSDNEGRIVLKCPPGKVIVAAIAPGFASKVLNEVEFPDDGCRVIQLDVGRQVEGQILDTRGRPVTDLLVSMSKEDHYHNLDQFRPKAHSGLDGRFTITNVSPGDWEISARSEDPNRPLFVAPLTLFVTSKKDLRQVALEASEGFRIKGRYVSGYHTALRRDGRRHLVFVGVNSPTRAHWDERTCEDGTFDFWGLPCDARGSINFVGVGGYHEIVKVPRAWPFFQVYGNNVQFQNVPPGTYDGIEVLFLLAGRVEGTVTDRAGNPVRGVEVLVNPPGYIHKPDEKGWFASEVAPGEATTITVRKPREQGGPIVFPDVQQEKFLLVSDPFTVQEGEIVQKHLIVDSAPHGDLASIQRGTPLSMATFDMDVKPETLADRKMLVCFFDVDQRPSRRLVQKLAGRATRLEENGLVVLVIHAGQADKDAVQRWLRESEIPFPAGTTAATMSRLQQEWTVQALPWMVLLDTNHQIQAAGFDLQQLDERLKDKSLDRLPAGPR